MFPFPKDWKKCLYMSLFCDFFAGVNVECFILKINQMLCCCFSVWLHICSVLNLLCHATASSRNRSPAYLPQQVLDWRLARHPDVSIAVPPSWDFLTNTPHYTIKKYCIPFCLCHTDSKSSTLCVMNTLFQSGLKNSQSGTSATIIVETEGFIWFDSVESLTGVATVISGEVANFFFFFFSSQWEKDDCTWAVSDKGFMFTEFHRLNYFLLKECITQKQGQILSPRCHGFSFHYPHSAEAPDQAPDSPRLSNTTALYEIIINWTAHLSPF